MPTNVWYTKLKMCYVPFLNLNQKKWMSLFIDLPSGAEIPEWNWQRQGTDNCVLPGTPACLIHTQVVSTFQRSFNFSTAVVLRAQLQAPAWPFSSRPVGRPFDISGASRAEWENRMRSWHQGNIWSQSWVTVRVDTACEDSFMPTVALLLCRLTAVECRHLPWLNLEWLPVYQQWAYSVSREFQIIITPGLLSETGDSFRCCIQASCWECCWE